MVIFSSGSVPYSIGKCHACGKVIAADEEYWCCPGYDLHGECFIAGQVWAAKQAMAEVPEIEVLKAQVHDLKEERTAYRIGVEDGRKLEREIAAGQITSDGIERDPYTGEDLTGKTEPCCECSEDYPRADLAIRGEVFCAKCRKVEAERRAKRKQG